VSSMARQTRRVLLVALLLARPLAGQQDRMQRVQEAFPRETAQQIETMIEAARGSGLPTDPLMDKALEGAAKGVPGDRVVAVLGAYSHRLGRAHELLGRPAETATVVAGADALQRGVGEDALRSLRDTPPGRAPVALVVLGDLVEAGVPAESALEVIRDAMARGQADDVLLSLPGAVRRLMRGGQVPEAAADAVRRGLTRDLPAPGNARRRRPPASDAAAGRVPSG
jgi:hypothetical protein